MTEFGTINLSKRTMDGVKTVTVGLVLVTQLSAVAGGIDGPLFPRTEPRDSRWSFRANLTGRFGVDAEFTGLGARQNPGVPLPPGSGVDRFYDDGFHRPDATGGAGNLTTFWGIESASQLGQVRPDSISFNLNQVAGNGTLRGVDDDTLAIPGFELSAFQQLGMLPYHGPLSKKRMTWGWNFGFFYQNVGVSTTASTTSDLTRVTDTFSSPGVSVGVFPYQGPRVPALGAPLISSVLDPADRLSQTIAGGAFVRGRYDIGADLFGLQVGPWLRVPLTEKVDFLWEAGVSGSLALAEYRGQSTTAIAGFSSQSREVSAEEFEVLPGGYIGGSLEFALRDGVFGAIGAKWQTMKDLSLSAGGETGTLDFSNSVTVQAGVGFRF